MSMCIWEKVHRRRNYQKLPCLSYDAKSLISKGLNFMHLSSWAFSHVLKFKHSQITEIRIKKDGNFSMVLNWQQAQELSQNGEVKVGMTKQWLITRCLIRNISSKDLEARWPEMTQSNKVYIITLRKKKHPGASATVFWHLCWQFMTSLVT